MRVDAVTKLFRKCNDVWKTAKITAMCKKGSKYEAKNYRLINLTCFLCKVFEKVIRNHILKHFEPFVHSSHKSLFYLKLAVLNFI